MFEYSNIIILAQPEMPLIESSGIALTFREQFDE